MFKKEQFVMSAIERGWADDGDIKTDAPHNFKFGTHNNSYHFLYPPRYLLNTNERENRRDFRV